MSRMNTRSASKQIDAQPVKAKTACPTECAGATGRVRVNKDGRTITILVRGSTGSVQGEEGAAAVLDVRNDLHDDGVNGVESSIAYNKGARIDAVVQTATASIPAQGDCLVVFSCSAGKVRSVAAACALAKSLRNEGAEQAFATFESFVDRQLWQDQIVKGSIE